MRNGIPQYSCPEVVELRRLTVGYSQKHQEFVPQVPSVFEHTQLSAAAADVVFWRDGAGCAGSHGIWQQ